VMPARQSGYRKDSGTSFATPYVSGTVALLLAAHSGLTPAQVRARLEATADPPPVSVPSNTYGYGIIDPFLAVTAVRDDTAVLPSAARGAPLPPPVAVRGANRHLQHVALAAGLGLIGLAVLACLAVVAFGRPRSRALRA
jgi:membrane-anchored mycosin MYCP